MHLRGNCNTIQKIILGAPVVVSGNLRGNRNDPIIVQYVFDVVVTMRMRGGCDEGTACAYFDGLW
jgi:hypothetical protein